MQNQNMEIIQKKVKKEENKTDKWIQEVLDIYITEHAKNQKLIQNIENKSLLTTLLDQLGPIDIRETQGKKEQNSMLLDSISELVILLKNDIDLNNKFYDYCSIIIKKNIKILTMQRNHTSDCYDINCDRFQHIQTHAQYQNMNHAFKEGINSTNQLIELWIEYKQLINIMKDEYNSMNTDEEKQEVLNNLKATLNKIQKTLNLKNDEYKIFNDIYYNQLKQFEKILYDINKHNFHILKKMIIYIMKKKIAEKNNVKQLDNNQK